MATFTLTEAVLGRAKRLLLPLVFSGMFVFGTTTLTGVYLAAGMSASSAQTVNQQRAAKKRGASLAAINAAKRAAQFRSKPRTARTNHAHQQRHQQRHQRAVNHVKKAATAAALARASKKTKKTKQAQHSVKSNKHQRHQYHTRPQAPRVDHAAIEEQRRQRDALIRQQEAMIRAAQERDKARKLAQQAEEQRRQQAERDKLEAQKAAEDARRRRQQITDLLSKPERLAPPPTTSVTSAPPSRQPEPPQAPAETAQDKKDDLTDPNNEDRKTAAGGVDRGQKFLSSVKNIAELAGNTPAKDLMDRPNTVLKGITQAHNLATNLQKDEQVAAAISGSRLLVTVVKAPGADAVLSTLESGNKARRALEKGDYAEAAGNASSALSKTAAGYVGSLAGPKGADMAVSTISTIETFGGDIVVANEERKYRDRAADQRADRMQDRVAQAKMEHHARQPFKELLDKNPGLAEKLQIMPEPIPSWHKEPPRDGGSIRPLRTW